MEGRVSVDGVVATKAGQNVAPDARIEVARPRRFVSRGGEKLDHALTFFEVNVVDLEALDVGASTGGFTDCLLQRGARSVTAVDVGYGQLDWQLRNDSRVKVMERTNFRHLPEDAFPEGFDLIVVDASFISLRTLLARAVTYLRQNGSVVALVKPQFEAGRANVGKGGIVRDPDARKLAVERVRECVIEQGGIGIEVIDSPILGMEGNHEYLLHARFGQKP